VDEVAALPESVHRWFQAYGWSPVEGMFQPNKRELWLHLSLLESFADSLRVLRRRLLPGSLPGPIDAVHIPEEQLTPARRMKKQARYAAYAASRAARHTRLLVPTAWDGFRWWLHTRQ
jgi:hypothetical protein